MHIIVYGIQILAIILLRLHLMRRNVLKRRAQHKEETKVTGEGAGENLGHKNAFTDLTDYENPDFRYVY